MAELPVLPLKTDALIADTTHMSAEEFGAYVRILIAMWRHGARLPLDHAELARTAGVTPHRWKHMAKRVLRPMTITPNPAGGGLISQKRLTDTWLRAEEIRKKRAQNLSRLPKKSHLHLIE